MNKVISKINKLRDERNLTIYKLSTATGIPANTIQNWSSRNSIPTVPVLEQLCKGFGITLADFFAEGNMVELTPNKKALIDDFAILSKSEQDSVMAIIKNYKDSKK